MDSWHVVLSQQHEMRFTTTWQVHATAPTFARECVGRNMHDTLISTAGQDRVHEFPLAYEQLQVLIALQATPAGATACRPPPPSGRFIQG